MQLLYRGISYDRQSQAAIEDRPLEGKYRGINWHSRQVKPISLRQTRSRLTYRGISYR